MEDYVTMRRDEQDKNWSLLSEESKYHYQTEYENRLEDAKREIEDPEGGGDLTVLTSQYIAKDLEILFGRHNLQPKLTYEDVAKELFENKTGYVFDQHDQIKEFSFGNCGLGLPLNCTTYIQADKLCAINYLLNVAKFLNKNEDGTDWVPNWENDEKKWELIIDSDDNVLIGYCMKGNTCPVYFRTEAFAKQCVEILGEETIRTALGNY